MSLATYHLHIKPHTCMHTCMFCTHVCLYISHTLKKNPVIHKYTHAHLYEHLCPPRGWHMCTYTSHAERTHRHEACVITGRGFPPLVLFLVVFGVPSDTEHRSAVPGMVLRGSGTNSAQSSSFLRVLRRAWEHRENWNASLEFPGPFCHHNHWLGMSHSVKSFF